MSDKFLELVTHPFKMRLFLLQKLPSAFFSGVRIQYADEQKSIVTIPYKWFSTNPFRSTYFACLAMAAEMSTGILAMAHVYGHVPPISMLVLNIEGTFSRKATSRTSFTCEDGATIKAMVKEAASSGKSTSVAARSVGTDAAGNIIAEFTITWSFKVKGTQLTAAA
ncbi:MAG: thioesterase [Ferruginibacter sp.]